MYAELKFRFGDFAPEIQDEIRSTNPLPAFGHLVYRDDHLLLPHESVTHKGIRILESDLVLLYDSHDEYQQTPGWLGDTNSKLMLSERFFGYIPNGRFRYGCAVATVNSFVEDVDESLDHENSVLTTKIVVTGTGKARLLYSNALKLYRLLRTRKVADKQVIELWPVDVPTNLVRIGETIAIPIR